MKYIDVDKLKAEIERLKAKYRKDMYKSNHEGLASVYKIEAYNEESEKPMNQDEDLNKEIKRFVAEYNYERGNDILLIAIVARHFAEWQKEQDEKEQADLFTIVALDAAQRAKEQMMNDGLDAIKSGQSEKIEKTIAGVFVKYGMDHQKELMLKEAIEGTIYGNGGYTWVAGDIPSQFKYGDIVKIIIVKKEENGQSD